MSNMLSPDHLRVRVRLWGVGLALVPGIVLTILTLASNGTGVGRGIALAAAPIAGVLAWFIAPVAARPDWRSGTSAAASFAIAAVLVGSIVVAAFLAMGTDPSNPNVPIASTMTLWLFGLVLLGLPMFGLTFLIALLWVAVLRAATPWFR